MQKRVRPVVLRVLRQDPLSRENDNRLVLAVCRELGYDLRPEQVDFISGLPSFAGIVRSRAKIQEQGRFLPPPEVWQKRHSRKRRTQ
jgi:hypothetical protein